MDFDLDLTWQLSSVVTLPPVVVEFALAIDVEAFTVTKSIGIPNS